MHCPTGELSALVVAGVIMAMKRCTSKKALEFLGILREPIRLLPWQLAILQTIECRQRLAIIRQRMQARLQMDTGNDE